MNKPILVALGASAGGLEALSDFVKSLKPGIGACYVVVQHLSPDNSSLLTELISRQTTLPVLVVEGGVAPLVDQIYITPPNHDIVYERGKLLLKEPSEKIGPKPSVNRMFHSLAAADDIFPVGVILSGTGTDGAGGMAAIKSAGGITMAQEPSSAKYNGMPLASIYAEAVDHVLEPYQMADDLIGLLAKGMEQQVEHTEQTAYYRIISIARTQSGVDLTHYKPATIERRIERRMHHTHNATMGDYADYLPGHAEEVDAFIKDVLIPVTEFFRDRDCFEQLSESLRMSLDNFPKSDTFRAWVPGCATGEEAYSIAITIEEINKHLAVPVRYQIFATDLDEQALITARTGSYPYNSIKDLPRDIVKTYFEPTGETVKVLAHLRDKITFSKHNLIQDPPFSRLNLISCRNLLIYFNNVLQKHVYELFHYALVPHGVLLLGKSESVNDNTLFNVIDRSHRVYERNSLAKRPALLPFLNVSTAINLRDKSEKKIDDVELDLEQLAYKSIAYNLVQRVMVVDNQDQLVFISDAAKEFLSFKSHQPSLVIYDLVPQPIRAELKAQLFKVRRNRQLSNSGFHKVKLEGREVLIQFQVFPLLVNSFEQLVVVVSEREVVPDLLGAEMDAEHEQIINQLQHELNATQESLQTVIEELETSNEELQATNEELQSTNEELQSTNEELQTTNEELQSTNEELLTVNDEVLQKNQQLEQLNNEFENLYQSSGIPYLILDKDLRVAKLHEGLCALINITEMPIGLHFSRLDWKISEGDLEALVNGAVSDGSISEIKVVLDQRCFRLVVRPYVLNRKEIAGAVISAIDITELEEKQQAVNALNRELEDILNVSPDGIIAINQVGIMRKVSKKAADIFGYETDELVNNHVEMLMDAQLAQEHPSYLKRYIDTGKPHVMGAPRRVKGIHKNGHMVPIELHVASFQGHSSDLSFIGVIRDITQLVYMGNQLKDHQKNASVALDNIDDAVIRFTENFQIVYANQQAVAWFKIDELGDLTLNEAVNLLDESSQKPIDFTEIKLDAGEVHLAAFTNDKQHRIMQFRFYPFELDEDDNVQYVMVIHDATEQEIIARQIKWQSRHDPLTGLLNRSELLSHLQRLRQRNTDGDHSNVLLFLDLDQFKIVNDSCGHKAGDELLRQLSMELLQVTRSRDLLARLGGDEFAIVLENCPIVRAEHIAENIIKQVQDFRFSYENKMFRIGVSIGIALVDNENSPEQLLSVADHACYAAKESGRNTYCVADQNAQQEQASTMLHIQNIAQAIDDDLFEFYFQEIIPSDPGKNKSYWEVLIRLRGENKQLMLPGSFLPIAERFNHAHLVDGWVFRNLAKVLKPLVEVYEPSRFPILSINLSAKSLSNKNLLSEIVGELSQSGLPLDNFCIEVTETAAISDFVNAKSLLRGLNEAGVKIALDDFGSGMASFNYIKQMPIDIIKIDGSIIQDLDTDLLDLTIAQSIQQIAEVLDCHTVAECVETQGVAKRLVGLKIDFIQGFYLSKPLSLVEWMKRLGMTEI
ncbi:MAG: EAL domain-containing protein [Enterobacterales bacterium]|nr:EAL domain-containing protein [Enterobacterales bacterium]